jgi:OOP family OmpA-OmpF porin
LKKIHVYGIAAIFASIQPAWGAEGLYLLGEVGQAQTGYPQTTADNTAKTMGVTGLRSTASSKPTSWRAGIGYQLNDNFSIEGSYVDVGKISYSATGTMVIIPVSGSEVVSATIWNLAAVGRYAVTDTLNLLGKVGVSTFKSTSQAGGTLAPAFASMGLAQKKTDISYGIGLEYSLSPSLGLRADWDSYSTGVTAQQQLSIYSAGMVYRF